MRTRVITGILLAAVLIPLLFVPPTLFITVMGVLTLIASVEFYRMVNQSTNPKQLLPYTGINLTLFLITALILTENLNQAVFMPLVFIIVILYLMRKVLVQQSDSSTLMLGTFYLGIPFATLSYIHAQGMTMLIYLLMLTMLTDIFAYFVGVKFGKHKLAPSISPKKTIEGSIGGTVVAVGIATPFALYFEIFDLSQNVGTVLIVIVFGVFISLLAQMGDLIASALKRQFDIKDFSNIFPGHGGVLDRFDSTMFASVILTLFLMLLEVM